MLNMLLLNRVDVAPMERNVTCNLLERNFTPAESTRLSAHPKLMTETFTTHLMLPRSRNESTARAGV